MRCPKVLCDERELARGSGHAWIVVSALSENLRHAGGFGLC